MDKNTLAIVQSCFDKLRRVSKSTSITLTETERNKIDMSRGFLAEIILDQPKEGS